MDIAEVLGTEISDSRKINRKSSNDRVTDDPLQGASMTEAVVDGRVVWVVTDSSWTLDDHVWDSASKTCCKEEEVASTASMGESQKERLNSMSSKSSSVNREYTQAFRTKSYVEMCTKVQSQIGRASIGRSVPSHPPCADSCSMANLSESLLEPGQETLATMIKTLNFHRLVVDFFEVSSNSCDVCELLLLGIHKIRTNYQRIRRAIKLAKLVFEDATHVDEQNHLICRELSAFAALTSPLFAIARVQFPGMHDTYVALLHELTSKRKQMLRRMKLARAFKKVGGLGLIVSCSTGMCNRKGKSIRPSSYPEKSSSAEGICAQLDVTAKGVYILTNDMDTVSRLAGRLQDEVEHGRSRAGMAVRNYATKGEIMREVVYEFFDAHNARFLEQLEELEEHIYLCLVTMNRSRMLVVEEILTSQSMS
ncbi:UPF0496 protein At1g20180-like [Rhodamnia argentea]|uniref:UPF0496 protein At1g20180-like n=1 Tax=Rhodamnia argentea TaxID=178133 RepID=A0ABM3H3Q9_9MYRT|nr:UPF0496 protein At1g20180-like [Rhodamnia argentea]